jgi:antitoxin ParD1/3/4
MDVHLSKDWEPFIRSQVQSGRYGSESEVLDEALRLLERRDLERAGEQGRVEALLIDGMDSGPSTPMTREDWDAIEREGLRLIAARHARKTR